MDEQTYRQAAALYDEQQLRLHESGHASAALLLGLEVSSIHTNGGHDGNTAPGETLIGYTSADHRDMALAILAGPLAEGRTAPRWPLAATTNDQQQLGEHVRELHLDESGYAELCDQARDLTASAPFKQLHASIVTALEQPPHNVGAAELRDLQRKALMQHKQLALAVVDTTEVGEGEMIALASTWELDKVGDQVMPGAYAQSVAKIKAGQRLPLIWGHDANGSPTNWVGEIDDADETPEGLKVHARFDLEDEAGRKAYRLAKQGRVKSLSIGYRLPAGSTRRVGGVNQLSTVELFEVSFVLTPANDGARILSVKADDATGNVYEQWRTAMSNMLDASASHKCTHSPDIKALERELTPITISTFDC